MTTECTVDAKEPVPWCVAACELNVPGADQVTERVAHRPGDGGDRCGIGKIPNVYFDRVEDEHVHGRASL